MRALAALALLLLASPAAAQEHRGVNTTIYVAGASGFFDAVSTAVAIERGAYERNALMRPFTGKPLAWAAVKGGTDAAVVYALVKARKQHPRIVVVTALGYAVLNIGLGVHNARVGRERR